MESQIGSWVTFNTKDDTSVNDEKKSSKQDDESSITSTEDTLLNKSFKVTNFIIENIRFSPKVIEFSNAFEGKQFSEKITIQNVGKDPVLVKIGEPNSFIFQLKKANTRTKFLPAGASITKTITYTYHNDDLVQRSQIPVQVNGFLVGYPIIVKKAEPEIEVHPQKLNFEIINLGASAKSMTLTIRNIGGRRTKFEIDCGKHLDLVVTPTRGTVKPKHSVNVCVEIMGFYEGEYYRELWIKTTEVPIRVPVLVEVVRPRLEIMYPTGTENFTLINFPPTFKGTQRVGSFVLKNVSNEISLYVALAEMNGKLLDLNEAKKNSYSFNMFMVTSNEGLLAPFESRIFNVLFCPKQREIKKGWHHKECKNKAPKTKSECDHVVFFWIQAVFYIEREELAKVSMQHEMIQKGGSLQKPLSIMYDLGNRQTFHHSQTDSSLTGPNSNSLSGKREEKSLRFCLHGQALDPDILIQPSELNFGDLNIGQKENKVLRITNHNIVGVRCKLCKVMNVTTTPQSIWLNGGKAHEFLVSLTPRSAGLFKLKLKIQLLAESDLIDGSKNLILIGTNVVNINYTAHDIPSNRAPKVGLGITPLVTDEVGFQKELITYKNTSKLPYAAMLGLKKGFKPMWMRKEEDQVKNVDNALVALPNDRPRVFHSWPKDKVCRTIFKGFFRYSPPEDLAYTLSSEGRIERKQRRAIWDDYISKKLLRQNYPHLEKLKYLEKDLSCRKHSDANCVYVSSKTDKNIKSSSGIKSYLERAKEISKFPLVPLSPLFLFHVKVDPKLINFNMVPVATKTQETVIINNLNNFPISIRFIPGNSNVSVIEDETVTIQSCATKKMDVFFESKEFGRYFGFLNYVINGAHEYKITISAFVTSKTLYISDTNLNLEFTKYGLKDVFQQNSIFLPLENYLPCPIKFKISLLEDTAFDTPISEGLAPPKSIILTEVRLKLEPGKSFYSEITLISESGNTELIKLSCPYKKIAVDFSTSEVNMNDIPLNLPTKITPEIINDCYHDVPFEVLTPQPMPGVTIIPKQGVIKARSFFYLNIIVKIPVEMKFTFNVVLCVHFSSRISLTVTGNVVCPIIRMRPSEVTLRKICEQSFDIINFCAVNEGTTRAEMKLDFSSCPEFKVVDGEAEFVLLPNQSSRIVVRFEPNSAARYIFYLPLIINNMLGPPMIQEPESEFASTYIFDYESEYVGFGEVYTSRIMLPCVCINCTVTQAVLLITPLSIDFRLECNSECQPQNITMVNASEEDITICMDTSALSEGAESSFELMPIEPSPAEVRPMSIKARLGAHKTLTLMATFSPKKYGDHKVEVPVYLKGYYNGIAYNVIRLSGTWMAPRILPTSLEVYFPPLPLGVACDVVLTICAENYSAPDTIKCLLRDSPDGDNTYQEQLLMTKWLKEPYVTESSKAHTFQLQITFQSFLPVALRNYIVLFDSMGTYSTILVTAVADNSAVTVHTFLQTKTCMYRLTRDSSTIQKAKLDEPILSKSETKSELKFLVENKTSSKSTAEFSVFSVGPESLSLLMEPIEKGPILVIQMTKSMNRISQLGFAKVVKHVDKCKIATSASASFKTLSKVNKTSLFSSTSTIASKAMLPNAGSNTGVSPLESLSYPNFPISQHDCWNYLQSVVTTVEKWMFQVVMRCDQYLSIPQSFQRIMVPKRVSQVTEEKSPKTEKDFLFFLEQIVGTAPKVSLPQRPVFNPRQSAAERASFIRTFFLEILLFLQSKGCLLPHIKPEHLMEYDEYDVYTKGNESVEIFYLETPEPKKMNLKVVADPSIQLQPIVKGRTDRDVIPKENSSVLFSKDFWSKSLSESVHHLGSEIEKMEDLYQDNTNADQNLGSTWNLVSKKQFQHETEILDEETFELRSKQSWLDIVIQIFRVFVLSKITKRNTIPQIKVFEMSDKKIVEPGYVCSIRNYFKKVKGVPTVSNVDSFSSNIYTSQERILLAWLNYHLQAQKDNLWYPADRCYLGGKVLNNFDRDLSDSVALISLTASHCPFIVADYFYDVFAKPETPDKVLHNAGRLIQAWRTLQLGMSAETEDIITPNPVFMIMLLTHLYEILPSIHPHSTICFSAPLKSEISRTIQIKNESNQRLFYEAKLFGEDSRFFKINASVLEVKPLKSLSFTVVFSVRKLRKITATLFLSGFTFSPDFAKHITFYLEGEPTNISEYEKISLSAPLYKVVCTEIPVKSPYQDPATYEVWYSTKKPEYSGNPDTSLRPWSSIWKTNVSRRLFLNRSEVTIDEDENPVSLNVTLACLTYKKRHFWLMFRSEIGDFIIMIEISAKPMEILPIVHGYYTDSWSPSATCTCPSNTVPKLSVTCPFLTILKIPVRNNALWSALRKMFLKTLSPEETLFWDKHFELDIGLCLILWLLSPDEEEEVVDEFVSVLPTKVTYTLNADSPGKNFVAFPPVIEIPDVREKTDIDVPIHISKEAPEKFDFKLTMTSENKKEIRIMRVYVQPTDPNNPGRHQTVPLSEQS